MSQNYLASKLREFVGPIIKKKLEHISTQIGRDLTAEESLQAVLGISMMLGAEMGGYVDPLVAVYKERYGSGS